MNDRAVEEYYCSFNPLVSEYLKEFSVDTKVLDMCYKELHGIIAEYLKEEFLDEAYEATLLLICTNIIAWSRIHKVNMEQMMQEAFEIIGEIVEDLERKFEADS